MSYKLAVIAIAVGLALVVSGVALALMEHRAACGHGESSIHAVFVNGHWQTTAPVQTGCR
jgi:hypothetical protein